MTGEEQINLLVDDSDECARLKNELTTNMDICVEDPMATPSERSCERQAREPRVSENHSKERVIKDGNNAKLLLASLSFIANITALACSAAFPTIGSKTVLMNATGIFQALAAPCRTARRVSAPHEVSAKNCDEQKVPKKRTIRRITEM
jgi:hypothetical protein